MQIRSYNFKVNQLVLLDIIHDISNDVHAITKLGGITHIEMNLETFELFRKDIILQINARYKIVIDKVVRDNEILLTLFNSIEGKIEIH